MTAAERWRGRWPVLLVASALAVSVLAFGDVDSAVRVPVVLWFVLVCPGMALVRHLRLDDAVAELMIGIALSAALATLAAGGMLYAGSWSPEGTLAVLVGVTVLGAAWDARTAGRRERGAENA
jgi:uncharacterized membrane protein